MRKAITEQFSHDAEDIYEDVAQAQGGLARDLLRDSLAAWAELALVPMRVWRQVTDDRSAWRPS